MTTDIDHRTLTTTRRRKQLYWVTTGLASLALAAVGAADLAQAPALVTGLVHLGYPAYLATILGAWKLLGVATLLAPGPRRLKEWAYAGFFFLLTGAALSHGLAGDPPVKIVVPVVLLGVVLASRALLPARQSATAVAGRVPEAGPEASRA